MSETKAEERITLVMPVQIDVQRLRDLLVSAVEGGSNYWARFKALERSDDLDYLKVEVFEVESHKDDGPGVRRTVTPEELVEGLKLLAQGPFPAARQHLTNFLEENDDAETADVVLQLTVFGELIYG